MVQTVSLSSEPLGKSDLNVTTPAGCSVPLMIKRALCAQMPTINGGQRSSGINLPEPRLTRQNHRRFIKHLVIGRRANEPIPDAVDSGNPVRIPGVISQLLPHSLYGRPY